LRAGDLVVLEIILVAVVPAGYYQIHSQQVAV
jgi:hypothetical protein